MPYTAEEPTAPLRTHIIRTPGDVDWINALSAALSTRGKQAASKPLDGYTKYKMLMSEHSPIRLLTFEWRWVNLPYWVSVHLTRHKIGIEHFVGSQRPEVQNDYDRRDAPQDAPVSHQVVANAQAIINISQARLCTTAAAETRHAWQSFLDALRPYAPELVSLCGPHCIHRNGLCPEVYSACRWIESAQGRAQLEMYAGRFREMKRR